MDDYIPQIKQSVKAGKIEQAKTLLATISDKHLEAKQEVLQILALAPDKIALELLAFLASSDTQDPDLSSRMVQLIIDRAHLNHHFILILFDMAPKQTIITTVPLLRHILSKETDKDLLNKIIRATGKIQIEHLIADIAEFIFYDDDILKQEAVRALERIGTPEACEKLIQASQTEKCDQNILDTIDVLTAKKPQSPEKPEKKQTDQKAPQIDVGQLTIQSIPGRFEALTEFSKNGAMIARSFAAHLETGNHDLIINLLAIISRSIPRDVVNDLFSIVSNKKTDNSIKFAAYNALAAFPELESAASVIQGVSESSMFVRLAAIKALDKNLSDFVCAEIRNKIESGTKKGEVLAQSILDARAKHLIEYLMISDTFSYMASNHLTRTAPIPVLDTFIHILEKRKLKSTARKYKDIREERAAEKRKQLIVISSSETRLDVYSNLIYSSGFSSKIFQRSQEAFDAIMNQQPDAILCDLFLNDMTGLDLSREVRELYSMDQVPVILCSQQRGLDESLLKEEITAAKIKTICEFPPKISQIKSWLKTGNKAGLKTETK